MGRVRRILGRATLAAVILTVALGIAGYTYLNSNYPADEAAVEAMESDALVQVYEPASGVVIFTPAEPEAGLIFYPGGKVEHTAYAPLLRALAREGIACILPEMPFDLAVLDMDAAERVREYLSDIERWYLGGHSLGGAMAASYVSEHADEYEGVILLAAYSTNDLKNKGLTVISLYGSEDGVLNREQYGSCRGNLPEEAVELVLEGGNHAQFGSYGPQAGDGAPEVSAQEQVDWAAEIISREIFR